MLNAAQVNWYWIPPKPHHQKQNEEEPLVLDHVFSYDQGKQAWANVHAFDHGELLTGQLRLLHQPPPQPPPTPPEKHIDLDGVINSVMDEVPFSDLLSIYCLLLSFSLPLFLFLFLGGCICSPFYLHVSHRQYLLPSRKSCRSRHHRHLHSLQTPTHLQRPLPSHCHRHPRRASLLPFHGMGIATYRGRRKIFENGMMLS